MSPEQLADEFQDALRCVDLSANDREWLLVKARQLFRRLHDHHTGPRPVSYNPEDPATFYQAPADFGTTETVLSRPDAPPG